MRPCPQLSAVLVCWLSLCCTPFAIAQPGVEFDEDRYLDHVQYLASEDLKGRGTGTPELDTAAAYVADQFQLAGLPPLPGRDYYQEFPVSTNAHLGKHNRLAFEAGGKKTELRLRRHFTPLSFSGAGKVSAQLVFAGYGISAPEYGYDDYASIDARGKIVVILRHEPQEYDRDSAFAGKIYTEHSQLLSKAINARHHGAQALIMVNDTNQHGGGPGDLTEFSTLPGPASAEIPFLHVDAEVIQGWFSLADRDFQKVQDEINENLRPGSFAFPPSLKARLRADLKFSERKVRNVVGYLPGHTDEYVVIGAHYDHIGLGEQFSMRPSAAGTIHLGADDNASGTAGLLELARWFAARPPGKRGLLFIAFAAEELGLLGSSHYVHHPLLPMSNAIAMINMDMIGRIRDRRVYIGGSTTGSTLPDVLKASAEESSLEFDLSDTIGYGSSDHTAFTTRQVPVLFFFSGLHGDYHRPSDTWDKINPAPSVDLLEYISAVVTTLSESDPRPAFLTTGDLPATQYQKAASPE